MENPRERHTSSNKRKNIQWTPNLEDMLLEDAAEAEPGKSGYWNRLEIVIDY